MKPHTTSAACALLLAFAACSSPPYPARSIEDDAEEIAQVVVTDAELEDVVRVGRANVERTPGTNQLRVVVPIRNIDDEEIQILAQMSFQNAQRQPIGDDTNRQVKIIGPGQTITYEALSRKAEAADWLLRLSWNK